MNKMMKRNGGNLYDASEAKMLFMDGNNLSTFEDEKRKELSSRNVIIDHLIATVAENEELRNKAKRAMSSFVKAYTTYPRALKSIFYIQNLDFYQVKRCFFVKRQAKFLKKGGMREQIRRNRNFEERENMRDVAQKMTKKRNIPSKISEF